MASVATLESKTLCSADIERALPAFLEDDIIATVSVEHVAGARAQFQTIIRRGQDLVAEVHSIWCALDATSRRPRRLRPDTIARFLQAPSPVEG